MTDSRILLIQALALICLAVAITLVNLDVKFQSYRITQLEIRVSILEAEMHCKSDIKR
jgi:hypothetical protein